MPSPFPGMDPFIEPSGYWGDFHANLYVALCEELNVRLPRGYVASIDLYVWIHEPDARQRLRQIKPDVYVSESVAPVTGAAQQAVAAAAPRQVIVPTVEQRQRKWVKIEDVPSRRVVTAVEVLSPANKAAGPERDAYLAKRNDYVATQVNLVEIDLLRGERRLPVGVAEKDMGDYYVLVWRSWEFPKASFWSFTIRDELPRILIPLVRGLPEIELPLQTCFTRVYDRARYAEKVRYDQALSPRLRKADAAWVKKLLAAHAAAHPEL